MVNTINNECKTQRQLLTSHDAVGEYQDVDVRWKLTDSEEHASDDAADDTHDTTSESVGQCTH